MGIIEEFLSSIHGFLKSRDALKLQDWLRVEPPLPDHYYKLSAELKAKFKDSNALERYIEKLLPEGSNSKADEGDVWPGLLAFMKAYLEFWREVNFENLLQTYVQLSELVNACITALSNASHGIVVLPTTIQLSAALAKLAMTLDKRPDLTRNIRKVTNVDQGGESRKTLVEGTAESIQRAFTMCLTERTSNRNGIGKDGKPEGKKVGIYSFANLVLKLLFQCRKTRLANQLFTNISQNSPPLSLYPACQRVAFLYYLGRFHFANGHFFHAQNCLQSAYGQCHVQGISQRRAILIYLAAANMILGRFPSPGLLSRSESDVLGRFLPVAKAIKMGDIVAFKAALGKESGNEEWFFNKGILLPLLYRCEVLVWRSLARRVFLLTYQAPGDLNSRKAPTLDLVDLSAAARHCQKKLEGTDKRSPLGDRQHTNAIFMNPSQQHPIERKKLSASMGVIYGNHTPKVVEIEAIVASLIQQGLLRGFISHNQGKFAILGAKQRGGPVNAGFPNVWEVIKSRASREGRDTEVPGWVKSERATGMGGVVNLCGIARPVGSGS